MVVNKKMKKTVNPIVLSIFVFFACGMGSFLYGCTEGGEPRINIEDRWEISAHALMVILNFVSIFYFASSYIAYGLTKPKELSYLFWITFIYNVCYCLMMINSLFLCNEHIEVGCLPESDTEVCLVPKYKQCINRNYPNEKTPDGYFVLTLFGTIFLGWISALVTALFLAHRVLKPEKVKTHKK